MTRNIAPVGILYDDPNTRWIAPPEDLITGKCVTKFSLKLQSLINPDTGKPFQGKTISAITDIPRPRISEYIHGKRPISTNHLIRLARALHCNPSDLIGVEYVGGD